jgi:hypothetical protein
LAARVQPSPELVEIIERSIPHVATFDAGRVEDQLGAFDFCKQLLQELLTGEQLFASPVLSYIAVCYIACLGYWLSPGNYFLHFNKVHYGLQRTLLGCSRKKWLMDSDSQLLAPCENASALATIHLDMLRKEWLYRDSGIQETVCNSIHRVWQLAVASKETQQPKGSVTWDASHEVLCCGLTQLCMSQWRELVRDLLRHCTTKLHEQLLFGLLIGGGGGGSDGLNRGCNVQTTA